nr:hypothetical protein [Methylobacterium sp. L1A1]
MIQRHRFYAPPRQLALALAAYPETARSTPEAARQILICEFDAADIAAGLNEAMEMARTGLVLAASNHPLALALGHARDVVALGVILIGGFALWAPLP